MIDEPGRATVALIQQGAWQAIRSRGVDGREPVTLAEMLERESAILGLERPCTQVFVHGQSFGGNRIESDVATGWSVRSDAEPNFGDYMSSDLLGFGTFVMVWADGRFRPPGGQAATPDTIFTITGGLGQ